MPVDGLEQRIAALEHALRIQVRQRLALAAQTRLGAGGQRAAPAGARETARRATGGLRRARPAHAPRRARSDCRAPPRSRAPAPVRASAALPHAAPAAAAAARARRRSPAPGRARRAAAVSSRCARATAGAARRASAGAARQRPAPPASHRAPARSPRPRRDRRRGAQVGDEVGERDVGLVPLTPLTTGRDITSSARTTRSSLNAHRSSSDPPPRHTSTTSTSLRRSSCCSAATSAAGASRALHEARVDDDLDVRRAPRQRRDDVVQRGAGGRRHDADGAHEGRQGPLSIRLEQAFGREPRAQAQELLVQLPGTDALHRFDDHLQLAARLVHGQAPAQLDLHPVLQRDVAEHRGAAEHRATQCTRAAGGIPFSVK